MVDDVERPENAEDAATPAASDTATASDEGDSKGDPAVVADSSAPSSSDAHGSGSGSTDDEASAIGDTADGRDEADGASPAAISDPFADDEADAVAPSDDDEAGDEPSSAASAAAAGAASSAAPATVRRRASRLWWALPILMVVEFYIYGHNGRLEICVGKQGDTDFSLVGQERTDENRWKFPRCETRLNLGLRSQYDDKVDEGLTVACRGATIFRHTGEAKACKAGDDSWQHEVEGHFVPPWDPAYYEHLFWFLQ
ncbi:MAG: hypothetical protein K0V04_07995 [Deltaproteobacteria bacterium]|nr:hypothetical protein [Deltaproteobacteria bacterium]